MTYFAGLDVSLEETAICIVDERGSIVKELREASEPEAFNAGSPSTSSEAPGIAARMDLCSQTVRFWIKRFNASGLQGLEEKMRSGRPQKAAGRNLVRRTCRS